MNSQRQDRREWALRDLRECVTKFAEKLPRFGAALSSVTGQMAADIIVSHRLLKRSAQITSEGAEKRRAASIAAFLERDRENEHIEIVMTDDVDWARLRLHHWFRGFRRTYAFMAPNGASAKAMSGYNDILSKLQDVSNWEVSPENLEYAVTIAYTNHSLKRLVRAKFREQFPYLAMNDHFREKVGICGYRIFKEMFSAITCINAISRVETVPKDTEDDRVITCEPLWNMICQLSFMRDMRRHLRKKLGYDINSRGDLHGTLVAHDVATIDLSAASDRVSVKLIRSLWPKEMWDMLEKLRPKYVESKENGISYLHMFSPMGTGITFDVMTCTILALMRFDRSATVFGDDIIVKSTSYERACSVLSAAGLVVNRSKSFPGGKFRESCGKMYHDDLGYITSYDLSWPEDICDWFVIVNKLALIIRAKQISFELEGIILRSLLEILPTLPRDAFADVPFALTSEFVTGYAGSRVSTGLAGIFKRVFHRECTFHSAYVKTAEVAPIWCDHTTLFGFFFRGDSPPVRKKIQIKRHTVETESGTAIRAVNVVPMGL